VVKKVSFTMVERGLVSKKYSSAVWKVTWSKSQFQHGWIANKKYKKEQKVAK
jgi:hypothetical protein